MEKSSAKSPWVGVVTTGGTYLLSEVERERDESRAREGGTLERTPLAPGEGTWSVFALKAVEERDALREENDSLKKEVARLKQREDEALALVSKLRSALKAYYHECCCQHEAMDAVNIEAYRLIRQEEQE
jgi:hypothetical protein